MVHLTCISRFQSFKSSDHSGDWKNNIPRAITWWTKKSPGPIVKNNELQFPLTACFQDKQLCYDCKGTILVCESFIRYETDIQRSNIVIFFCWGLFKVKSIFTKITQIHIKAFIGYEEELVVFKKTHPNHKIACICAGSWAQEWKSYFQKWILEWNE